MKVGAKKEEQVPMSGKDKAKLLKMMKEQNKPKEQPVPSSHGQMKPKLHNSAPVQSGLPSDFFDTPASAAPSLVPVKETVVQSKKAPAPAANTISNLPKGFFDNPVEDLGARGITMEQYTASMEKEEQAELDSFLTQLKEVEGEREHLEEASFAREESTREYEEEAAQMAYLANLIALRAQSEKLQKSTGNEKNDVSNQIVEEGNEALHHLLKEVNEVRALTQTTTNAALDVDNILYQKLAQSAAQKRKREAILSTILSTTTSSNTKDSAKDSNHKNGSVNESNGTNSDSDGSSEEETESKKAKPAPKYTPLNFMNWTSRTY